LVSKTEIYVNIIAMLSNRTLQVAFLISFGFHAVIVAQNPGYLFFSSPQEKSRNIEINYKQGMLLLFRGKTSLLGPYDALRGIVHIPTLD